ncbi:hypothetical protein Tco_1355357 [Tanacetum coccineum]
MSASVRSSLRVVYGSNKGGNGISDGWWGSRDHSEVSGDGGGDKGDGGVGADSSVLNAYVSSAEGTARDRQKSYADNRRKPLEFEFACPLEEIKVDKTLRFVEEPVEIIDREVKSLKRSRILLVKVRWNSKRGPEFTWEREDYMKSKYPQLFVDRADESARFGVLSCLLKLYVEIIYGKQAKFFPVGVAIWIGIGIREPNMQETVCTLCCNTEHLRHFQKKKFEDFFNTRFPTFLLALNIDSGRPCTTLIFICKVKATIAEGGEKPSDHSEMLTLDIHHHSQPQT